MTRTDMGRDYRIEAETGWPYRLFTLGTKCVTLTEDTLLIERVFGDRSAEIPVGAIDSITVRPSWFWHRLSICLGDGTVRSVGGLNEEDAKRVRDAVIGQADGVAELMSPLLKRLDERLRQLFAGDRYARYGESRELHADLAPVLQRCKRLVRRCLDREAAEALAHLDPLATAERF